jgi:hypothetical protein
MGKPQAMEDCASARRAIAHAEAALNDLLDARRRQLATRRAACAVDRRGDPNEIDAPASGSRSRSQRGRPSATPSIDPLTHSLARHVESTRNFSLRCPSYDHSDRHEAS